MSEVHEPPKIAEKTKSKGTAKTERGTGELVILGLLAGVYIAFGGLFATVAQAGELPFGAGQVLAGVAFSLGLILVLIGGAELFTGNTLMVVTWAERDAGPGPVLRALGWAYVTNLVGSLAVVALALAAGVHMAGDGAVGAAALQTANQKAGLTFGAALASGVLANMLVCLAVWMAYGAKSAADKVLVIIPPIAAFVALGLEHSVANMSLIPLGWGVKEFADPSFWRDSGLSPSQYPDLTLAGFALNLAAATIGNVIGGAVIGGAYWFALLRKDDN
jgi:formate transporter